MPRNSSGEYSLPAGNPVASGTVISSTWANATMPDLGAEITNSLDRSGRGGMLVPFQNVDGTVIAPGITFTTEPGSGLYRNAANDIRMTVGSDDATRWIDASGQTVGEQEPFQIWNGSSWESPLVSGAVSALPTLPNNVALQGRNFADDGNIDVIKVNASDQVEVPRQLRIVTSGADPTGLLMHYTDAAADLGKFGFSQFGGHMSMGSIADGELSGGTVLDMNWDATQTITSVVAGGPWNFNGSIEVGVNVEETGGINAVFQMNQTGGVPASSGTVQTYGIARFRPRTFPSVIDIGGNGGTYQWIQATNADDLSVNYPLYLNPNGGSMQLAANALALNAATKDATFAGHVGVGAAPESFRDRTLEVSGATASLVVTSDSDSFATLRLRGSTTALGYDINYNFPAAGSLGFLNMGTGVTDFELLGGKATFRGTQVHASSGRFLSTTGSFPTLFTGDATFYGDAASGMVLAGHGATNDLLCTNQSGATVWRVPQASTTLHVEGLTINKQFNIGGLVDVTISAGSVSAERTFLRVNTEGGAGADDLSTIFNHTQGAIIIVTAFAPSRIVTLKDNVGNLRLNGDFVMNQVNDTIMLLGDSGGNWTELSRSNND